MEILLWPLPYSLADDWMNGWFSGGSSRECRCIVVFVVCQLLLFLSQKAKTQPYTAAVQEQGAVKQVSGLQPIYQRLNPKTSCPSTRGVSGWVTTGPDAGPCSSHGTLGRDYRD